jgi:hypothetical protein
MRLVKLGWVMVMLFAVLAAVGTAQTAVPTVAVSAGKSAITATPGGPIAPGPTRFTFTRNGSGDVDGYLATLRAGVTTDELRQSLAKQSEEALGLVFLEASVSLSDQAQSRALTVTLRPNVTYVLVSSSGRSFGLTTLATTGTDSGAQAPAPDARIRMVDYGFRGPGTLPRQGVIRVENRGAAYHFALAFPLRQRAKAKRVKSALRTGNEKALERVVAGAPITVQNLISPGSANDDEIRFARRGRYAFVCFFGAHNALGMYKIFRVR